MVLKTIEYFELGLIAFMLNNLLVNRFAILYHHVLQPRCSSDFVVFSKSTYFVLSDIVVSLTLVFTVIRITKKQEWLFRNVRGMILLHKHASIIISHKNIN